MLADWTKIVPPSPWLLARRASRRPLGEELELLGGELHLGPPLGGHLEPTRRGRRRGLPAAGASRRRHWRRAGPRPPLSACLGRPGWPWPPRRPKPRAVGSAASASASSSESVFRVPSGSKWAGDLADRGGQDDRALDLPLEPGEVGLGLGVEVDDRRDQRALGAGRPRLGIGDQRDALRLDHLGREPLERPAAAERPPRLEVGVGQPPRRQSVARPLVRALHVRRAGQPRADHVGQVAQGRHDLRLLEPLFLDAVDRVRRRLEVSAFAVAGARAGRAVPCRRLLGPQGQDRHQTGSAQQDVILS